MSNFNSRLQQEQQRRRRNNQARINKRIISASRIRRAVLAGLAICAVAGAPGVASIAEAGTSPRGAVALPVVCTGPGDLYISNSTPTTVRVSNTGRCPAGPFTVLVARGLKAECNQTVAPVTRRVAGLAIGGSVTISVPAASFDRAVTVDYWNEVAEVNELNNRGTGPGEAPSYC
jgi:hypothetical protein